MPPVCASSCTWFSVCNWRVGNSKMGAMYPWRIRQHVPHGEWISQCRLWRPLAPPSICLILVLGGIGIRAMGSCTRNPSVSPRLGICLVWRESAAAGATSIKWFKAWLVSFFLDKPSGCGEALMQAHTRSGCAMHGLLESNSSWLLFEPAISGYGGIGPFGWARQCSDRCRH